MTFKSVWLALMEALNDVLSGSPILIIMGGGGWSPESLASWLELAAETEAETGVELLPREISSASSWLIFLLWTLWAFAVQDFFGQTNRLPSVRLGVLDESAFGKWWLQTWLWALTSPTLSFRGAIQACFLVRSAGNHWRETDLSFEHELPQIILLSPGISQEPCKVEPLNKHWTNYWWC